MHYRLLIPVFFLSSVFCFSACKKSAAPDNSNSDAKTNASVIPLADTDTAVLNGKENAPSLPDPSYVEASGIIVKAGNTTYQYGRYALEVNHVRLYALDSDSINLADYLNKECTISGHKVKGYPVDGGPDYLEVETIR